MPADFYSSGMRLGIMNVYSEHIKPYFMYYAKKWLHIFSQAGDCLIPNINIEVVMLWWMGNETR